MVANEQLTLSQAVRHLAADGLLAVPTETVWGLAACACSEPALEALRRFKKRDADKPISIFVSGAGDLDALGIDIGPDARALTDAFWPGPLTLVLPAARARFARGVARETDGAVGVRCSPHPELGRLVEACLREGLGPLTATSLNESGDPPATTRGEASALCLRSAEPARVLDVTETSSASSQPSTVVDCTVAPPRILRPGALTETEIQQVLTRRDDEEAKR